VKQTSVPIHLQIIGDIDFASFAKFDQELRELEEAGQKVVGVLLSSQGGSPEASLAFASRMRLSPCDIHIVVMGCVYSAAIIILAYGDKRFMTRESWAMVHEEKMKINDRVTSMERQVAVLRKFEDQAADLLFERTGTDADTWKELHEREAYLTPEACKQLNLIEEIL
jgi:ATP-dependent protease ClpP protease subunit